METPDALPLYEKGEGWKKLSLWKESRERERKRKKIFRRVEISAISIRGETNWSNLSPFARPPSRCITDWFQAKLKNVIRSPTIVRQSIGEFKLLQVWNDIQIVTWFHLLFHSAFRKLTTTAVKRINSRAININFLVEWSSRFYFTVMSVISKGIKKGISLFRNQKLGKVSLEIEKRKKNLSPHWPTFHQSSRARPINDYSGEERVREVKAW